MNIRNSTRGTATLDSTRAARKRAQWRKRALGAAVTSALAVSGSALAATISYNSVGSNYTQNFDTLPTSGSFPFTGAGPANLSDAPVSATNMDGWQISRNTGGNNLAFTVGTGSGNTGSLYDFGLSGTDTDRALGSLASSNFAGRFGAVITNNTGVTLNSFTLSYTGEQWRSGGNTAIQTLTFGYSLGAADISTSSTFTTVNALSFNSPFHTSGSPGALNGSLNTAAVSSTVSGLSWGNGQTLVIRWTDVDDSGNDHGLAVDDLSFSANTATASVTWGANSNNTWDTSTSNWTPGPTTFANGDTANFTDTAVGAVIVDAGGVQPGTINVSNASGGYTFSGGVIGGSASLTKTNAGSLKLSSTNNYTGGTNINGGTLVVDGGDDRLGNSIGGISFAGGGVLQTVTSGLNSTRSITVNAGGGTFDTNGLDSSISGAISGAGAFSKIGNGNLTLTGAWTYTGELAIKAGKLTLGAASGIHPFTASTSDATNFAGDLDIVNGIRVNFNAGNLQGGGLIRVKSTGTSLSMNNSSTASTEIFNNISLNSDNVGGTFNTSIGSNSNNNLTISGIISGASDVQYAATLGGGGAGTVLLKGANNYSGSSTINLAYAASSTQPVGIVRIGVNDALPNTPLIFGTTGGNANAGALDLNGKNQKVASLASTGSTLANGITNFDAINLSTLTITGSATTTYSSTIGALTTGSNIGASTDNIALHLDSSHTGVLTLTHTGNTYAGGTVIDGGTLRVNGAISGAGAVAVNNTGKLAGSGSVSGAVTIASTATIAPGNTGATSSAPIALGNGLTLNGTYAWDINDDQNNGAGALSTTSNFDQISVTNGSVSLGANSVLNISYQNPGDAPGLNGFWASGRTFTIIDGTTSSGAFNALNYPTTTAGAFTLSYANGDTSLVWTPSATGPHSLTWDGGSTGGASDTDGTWNAANTNWFDGSSDVAFSSTRKDIANFGAGGGGTGTTSVAVSGTVTASELNFNANSKNYSLTGGTIQLDGATANGITASNNATIASALNFVSARNVSVTGTNALTFGGVVSGSAITKTNSGTLVLTSASNSFSSLTVTGGKVAVGSDAPLGGGAVTLDGSTATLLATAGFTSASRSFVMGTNGGTIDTNSFNVTLSGNISGAGPLKKVSAGVLRLTNSGNTFGSATGGVDVEGTGSILSVDTDGALGNGAAPASFGNMGGTIRLGNGFSSGRTFTTINGGTSPAPTGGYLEVLGTDTATISSNITGGARLTKFGTGTLVISSTAGSTATGTRSGDTYVEEGTLRISGSNESDHHATGLGIGKVIAEGSGTIEIANTQVGTPDSGAANQFVLNDGGRLIGTGTARIYRSSSSSPQVPVNGNSVYMGTGNSTGDFLEIGNTVRNVTSSTSNSSTVIHIIGNGIVWLASGPTSLQTNTDHFTGSWSVDSGVLQVGPVDFGSGETFNALGYNYGTDAVGTGPGGGARPVTLVGGTLAGANEATSGTYKSPIIFSGGTLSGTQVVTGVAYSGPLTVNAGTSHVRLADAEVQSNPPAVDVNLITTAFMTGDATWNAGANLHVYGGGTLHVNRSTGAATVASGATPQITIDEDATVSLENTADLLADTVNNRYVNVVNNATNSHGVGGLDVLTSHNVGVISGTGVTTIEGAGSPVLTAGAFRGDTLTVHSTDASNHATAKVRLDGTSTGTSKINTLNLDANTQLDLTNNKAVITGNPNGAGVFNGSSYNGVAGLVQAGRTSGTWAGSGIVTSLTAAKSTGNFLTNLAVASASAVKGISGASTATFGGQTVHATDALVMYTYNGDANLSGHVDADDYFLIDSHYNKSANSVKLWINGDFNYDGKINGDDYMLIDNAYVGQGAPFSTSGLPGGLPGGVSAVPEPASLGLIGMAAVGLFGRRRRRSI